MRITLNYVIHCSLAWRNVIKLTNFSVSVCLIKSLASYRRTASYLASAVAVSNYEKIPNSLISIIGAQLMGPLRYENIS